MVDESLTDASAGLGGGGDEVDTPWFSILQAIGKSTSCPGGSVMLSGCRCWTQNLQEVIPIEGAW